MKETLREVRGLIKEDTTTSYPPKEINKKKHDAYKDPKRGEHEPIKKETNDPSVDDIAKGLKLDKKLVKKIMGEVFDYDEKVLDENVSQQIKTLKTIMAPMRGAKISIDGANKLMKIMDKFDKKEDLIALFKADIPFVSQSAAARLISKFRMSGAEVNKLREEVELDEMYTYTVVHVKHDKEVVKANSSYEAAKKYAQMKGLKSTAGVDAYLMKEETINEFTKKDFDKNEDENKHTENGVAIVNKFGTSAEKKKMKDIQTRHNKAGSITIQDQQARDKMINKYYNKLESVNLDERMGPIRPRHYDVEVTIKNARDAEAVDEYISNNMSFGIEDYDNDGIITANGYTAGTVNFHGDDAGHIGMEIQKKFRGKVKVVGEAVEIAELNLAVESMFQAEDKRNTEKAFDDMIKDGGIDKKDYEKSKKMYKSGDLQGLRKFIYKLDTEPLEAIMQTIMQNDPKAFRTMYPNAKRGDFLARISYAHGLRKSQNEQYFTGARGLVEKLAGIELTEIDASAVKSLEKKSKASGIPLGILKQVFKRGMAAWGSGSRTGMDQTQWSHARVNSFIAKKPGTWGGADKDLAKKAKGS